MLRLLGVPNFNGESEDIPPSLALLLVAYLAYDERWLSRATVAGLLWPDKSEARARQNLSQLLYVCKEQGWAEALEIERNRIRYGTDTDLTVFRASVAQGNWSEALGHYRGEFLSSVSLKVSPEFDVWLTDARQELFSSWCEAAVAYSQTLIAKADYTAAADLLAQVLQHDELAEDLLQSYLKCHLELDDSKRRRALQRFERFVVKLRKEMDLEPLAETIALAELLKEKAKVSAHVTIPAARSYGFPSYPSSFIGREVEQLELGNLLGRSDVRLLTLLGPGGIGKTRLAAHFAQGQTANYGNGVVFIQLAALSDASLVPSSLLAALTVTGQANQAQERKC
jgi:DNA-binding SARP family transcriptional activator